MRTSSLDAVTGTTIFDAPGDDPRLSIAGAMAGLDSAARRYHKSSDLPDATALLDAIEGLRRFVLVRATLAGVLSEPLRPGAEPVGRQLCEALHAMIGDVPGLVAACTRDGRYRMERDTRRAIACLNFLGSLNHRFI